MPRVTESDGNRQAVKHANDIAPYDKTKKDIVH
jgi:hypothetical protein